MTDKQIIDRVNVKECKYYCNGKCERYEEFVEADYANYSVKCICEKENDLGTYDICDYQQLKRKEQECEKAKQNAQDTYDLWQALIESFNILQGEKIKLEQKCERLENENKRLVAELTNPIFDSFEELDKLKQTLAEIKEICKNVMPTGIDEETDKFGDILDIINEVENDN